MKLKEKPTRGRTCSRWEWVKKDVTQKDERTWKETEKEFQQEKIKGRLCCKTTHINMEPLNQEVECWGSHVHSCYSIRLGRKKVKLDKE